MGKSKETSLSMTPQVYPGEGVRPVSFFFLTKPTYVCGCDEKKRLRKIDVHYLFDGLIGLAGWALLNII